MLAFHLGKLSLLDIKLPFWLYILAKITEEKEKKKKTPMNVSWT